MPRGGKPPNGIMFAPAALMGGCPPAPPAPAAALMAFMASAAMGFMAAIMAAMGLVVAVAAAAAAVVLLVLVVTGWPLGPSTAPDSFSRSRFCLAAYCRQVVSSKP